MIEFNTDNVSSIALKQLKETPIIKNSVNKNFAEEKGSVDGESTNTSISISAKDSILNATEENATNGLDLLKIATDALGEIHENLSLMKDVLNDLSSYPDSLAVLNLLDEQSNVFIEKIFDIYNNTEFNGVKIFSGAQSLTSTAILDNYKNFVFSLGNNADIYAQMIVDTKINLEGLESIKNLDIDDENYIDKLNEIIKEIDEKHKKLQEQSKDLETIIADIYNSHEATITNFIGEDKDVTSKDIQKQIIQNVNSTLQSVSNISADSVLSLLKRV